MDSALQKILPLTEEARKSEMAVQERIHGHRLTTDQLPYMVVLEALAVCASVPLGEHAPKDGQHESFSYNLPHNKKMRFLLFAERHLDNIAQDNLIPENSKWEVWKRRINSQYGNGNSGQDNFAYLDSVFNREFSNLRQAIKLLRSFEMDVMNSRRWTSRFLAVTGPQMICCDMRETAGGSWSADRRFFARGGELLYLMLNRSGYSKQVQELLDQKILNQQDPINRIALSLCDSQDTAASSTSIGYLPAESHPAYDRLAEDWLQILTIDGLPNGHLFEPLVRISGLNMAVYLAERASEISQNSRAEPFILDFTSGADKQLRQCSGEHLIRHRYAAKRAVTDFIRRTLAGSDAWSTAVTQKDNAAAAKTINVLFHTDQGDLALKAPQAQVEVLEMRAQKRPKNNAFNVLLPLLKETGLANARAGVGTWFDVNDDMILALVLANSPHTLELSEFVARLYQRYGLVIGPDEAREAFSKPPISIQSFEANLAAFEARMTRLGLTRRLSDDCAFVSNPYRQDYE